VTARTDGASEHSVSEPDSDERAAIQAEPPLPSPGTPERGRIDAEDRAVVGGLLAGYARARRAVE
jgi:hypothetical protein